MNLKQRIEQSEQKKGIRERGERERKKYERTEVVHKDVRIVEWEIGGSAEIKKILCHKAVGLKRIICIFPLIDLQLDSFLPSVPIEQIRSAHAQIKLSTTEQPKNEWQKSKSKSKY